MKFTHKKYQEIIKMMLMIAEVLNLPHYHLEQHQHEIEKAVNRAQCNHFKLVMHQQKNVRIWKCANCGKIIDYETIG